jgi:hypothetical protein
VSEAMYDVRPEQYAMVIREMLRHENDLTNHRIMWLLIGQGFIANAFVSTGKAGTSTGVLLASLGLFLSISAFVMLYRSYQARGYLRFLGERAKRGMLQEKDVPILGWPAHRIKGWSKEVWDHPWFAKTSDLLEPWLFLPYLFVILWLSACLRAWSELGAGAILMVAGLLSAVVFAGFCRGMTQSWSKDEVDS